MISQQNPRSFEPRFKVRYAMSLEIANFVEVYTKIGDQSYRIRMSKNVRGKSEIGGII